MESGGLFMKWLTVHLEFGFRISLPTARAKRLALAASAWFFGEAVPTQLFKSLAAR
jgi:hypothetical protein